MPLAVRRLPIAPCLILLDLTPMLQGVTYVRGGDCRTGPATVSIHSAPSAAGRSAVELEVRGAGQRELPRTADRTFRVAETDAVTRVDVDLAAAAGR